MRSGVVLGVRISRAALATKGPLTAPALKSHHLPVTLCWAPKFRGALYDTPASRRPGLLPRRAGNDLRYWALPHSACRGATSRSRGPLLRGLAGCRSTPLTCARSPSKGRRAISPWTIRRSPQRARRCSVPGKPFGSPTTSPRRCAAGLDCAKLGFLMYPQAETAGLLLDYLDPDSFRYTIRTKELTAA